MCVCGQILISYELDGKRRRRRRISGRGGKGNGEEGGKLTDDDRVRTRIIRFIQNSCKQTLCVWSLFSHTKPFARAFII